MRRFPVVHPLRGAEVRPAASPRTLPGTMPDDHFGPGVAERYDEDSAAMFAPEVLEPAVDRLAALAGDRPALELAIGTGRVGLALARRGVAMSGIELSSAMVEQLRAKPGGAEIPVTIGDMATTTVPGRFGLVYLVFNTIVNLTTQEAQTACFRNAAAHLEPGGCFVVEVGIPQLRRLPPGERGNVIAIEDGYWGIDEFDVVEQKQVSHHFHATKDGVRHAQIPFRYVWPSELDLMAQLAGLRLRERWADWHGAALTADSRSHVSVWEKPA
jgi:SAM-dependent methyltransferase